jgi:hypothetical protein
MSGYSIAKHDGFSIIRDNNSQVQKRHISFIGGAMFEVMDREGEIHRFDSRREMENFVNGFNS